MKSVMCQHAYSCLYVIQFHADTLTSPLSLCRGIPSLLTSIMISCDHSVASWKEKRLLLRRMGLVISSFAHMHVCTHVLTAQCTRWQAVLKLQDINQVVLTQACNNKCVNVVNDCLWGIKTVKLNLTPHRS